MSKFMWQHCGRIAWAIKKHQNDHFDPQDSSIVDQKSSGPYKNLKIILQSCFPSWMLLYLLKNLTSAILLSSMARCLPIQVLVPALNPPSTQGGRLLHYCCHLSGMNLVGSRKYQGLQWLVMKFRDSTVSLWMGMLFRQLSLAARLKNKLVPGPCSRVTSFWISSMQASFLRLSQLQSSFCMCWSISSLTFFSTSGCLRISQIIIWAKVEVVSVPATKKIVNSSKISSLDQIFLSSVSCAWATSNEVIMLDQVLCFNYCTDRLPIYFVILFTYQCPQLMQT